MAVGRVVKRLGGLLGGLLVALLVAGIGPVAAQTAMEPVAEPVAAHAVPANSMTLARDRVLPVVVSILVVREDFQQGQPVLSVSSGSGTVVTPEGHIATNAHVVQNGRNFRVVFADGRELPARLVGSDPLTDLAVLQAQPAKPEVFAHARFAEQLDLRAGDTVFAMGAPWGLSNSMSAGVVNNPRRLLVSLFGDESDYEAQLSEDEPTGRYYAWIQHDAAIAPGNSGGPLVDVQGRIVGVNSRAMIMGGDLAFAIPGPDAGAIVATLIAKGRVTRANLGFRLRSLKGSGFSEGVLVSAIERGSVAEAAGLQVGDRLLAMGDVRVDAPQPVDVPAVQRHIAELPVGQPLRLRIERNGKPKQITVTPQPLARDGGDERALPALGMSVLELTPAMRRARNLDESQGLVIVGLQPGGSGATARPALARNDLLTRINGTAVTDVAGAEAVLANLPDGKPVLVEFNRNAEQRIAIIKPQSADRERVPLPELPKAWSGAEVQPVPASLARDANLPGAGFRIVRLYANGPLEKAGAKVGDYLTALNDEPLRPTNETSDDGFQQRVRDLAPGSEIRFSGYRGNQPLNLQARLVEAPASIAGLRTLAVSRLRVQLRELGFYDRVARRLSADSAGVLVDGVESGGPAGMAHLRNGDVILALAGERVDSPAALSRRLDQQLAAHPTASIPLTVLRGPETRILYLEPYWLTETP